MKEQTMLLVGCGNMGYAMLTSWIAQKIIEGKAVYVVEPNETNHEKITKIGCHVVTQAAQLPAGFMADFVIFAIKPQLFEVVIPAYIDFAAESVFISVIAGISSTKFEQLLGANAALIRVMPNTPAAIGEGAIAFCNNGKVAKHQLDFAKKLLQANGQVIEVHENQMDAVTGLSGSGPAYVFYLIECLTQAGIEAGLEAETALTLARQTVKGAGILAATSNTSPAILREQVTSPNGTTAAGLRVLMSEERMQNMMRECVKAARDRSVELGS